MSEEDLILWYDIIQDVHNRKLDGHVCPYCLKGVIHAEMDNDRFKLSCKECGKYIEGRIDTPYDEVPPNMTGGKVNVF